MWTFYALNLFDLFLKTTDFFIYLVNLCHSLWIFRKHCIIFVPLIIGFAQFLA